MQPALTVIPGRTPTSPQTGLTLKQEAFAQAIADGMNQSAAYRAAYRADGMAPATIWREASLLAKTPKVAARLEELRERNVREVLRERAKREAYVLDELHRIAEEAVSERDRLKALELLGKSVALGWLFGAVVLFFLWYRSLPAHEEWLTLWIALCLWAVVAVGYTGLRAIRARMKGTRRTETARWRPGRYGIAGALLVVLVCLSWLRTEGGFESYAYWIKRNGDWVGAPSAAECHRGTGICAGPLHREPPLKWSAWRVQKSPFSGGLENVSETTEA